MEQQQEEQQHAQEQQEVDLKRDWGYKEYNGPERWCQEFPVANGNRQSPIDIDTTKAIFNKELSDFPLEIHYTPEETLTVVNNGHSIQATINQTSELQGGPLKEKHRLVQFHFHWGAKTGQGSEHTVDGKAYDAELHLVHYNCEKYDSFAKAVDKEDGLAVLGVFLKEREEGQGCAGLKPLTDNVKSVEIPNKPFNCCENFDPKSLLPDNLAEYWTYPGSLTTPPLFESVTWIVLRNPVEISNKQLESLRSLKDSHDDAMQDNFRPPCPFKGRTVYKSFN